MNQAIREWIEKLNWCEWLFLCSSIARSIAHQWLWQRRHRWRLLKPRVAPSGAECDLALSPILPKTRRQIQNLHRAHASTRGYIEEKDRNVLVSPPNEANHHAAIEDSNLGLTWVVDLRVSQKCNEKTQPELRVKSLSVSRRPTSMAQLRVATRECSVVKSWVASVSPKKSSLQFGSAQRYCRRPVWRLRWCQAACENAASQPIVFLPIEPSGQTSTCQTNGEEDSEEAEGWGWGRCWSQTRGEKERKIEEEKKREKSRSLMLHDITTWMDTQRLCQLYYLYW